MSISRWERSSPVVTHGDPSTGGARAISPQEARAVLHARVARSHNAVRQRTKRAQPIFGLDYALALALDRSPTAIASTIASNRFASKPLPLHSQSRCGGSAFG